MTRFKRGLAQHVKGFFNFSTWIEEILYIIQALLLTMYCFYPRLNKISKCIYKKGLVNGCF